MALPFIPTYLQLQTVRASAALELLSAWDTATELYCPSFEFVTFYLSYTEGAASGIFEFMLEVSPYTVDLAVGQSWFQQGIVAGGGVVVATDTTSLTQREDLSYGAVGAAIENFVYGPCEFRGTIQRLRMSCRETAGGTPLTPGTVHIVATFA